jgi:hypothetical protein
MFFYFFTFMCNTELLKLPHYFSKFRGTNQPKSSQAKRRADRQRGGTGRVKTNMHFSIFAKTQNFDDRENYGENHLILCVFAKIIQILAKYTKFFILLHAFASVLLKFSRKAKIFEKSQHLLLFAMVS